MPSPVCWYHFCPSGLMPAAFQSPFSLAWVPELSPRDRKRLPAAAIFLKASECLFRSLDLGRVGGGADDDEVVVHDEPAVDAVSVGHELLLRSGGVDEQHVRLALLAHGHGLAGADGDRLDEVAGLLLEDRDQDVEQPRVLGAGRRGQDDVLLCRLRRRGAAWKQQAGKPTAQT